MFPYPVEQQRRDQGGERTTQRAARAHDEIEQGQAARARPFEIEAAVERGRQDEQHQHGGEADREAGRVLAHHRHPAREQNDDRRHAGERITKRAALVESEDEAQQIEAERHHP